MENGAILGAGSVALRPWRLTSCVIFDFTDLIDKCPQGGAPSPRPTITHSLFLNRQHRMIRASAFRPRRYRAMRR